MHGLLEDASAGFFNAFNHIRYSWSVILALALTLTYELHRSNERLRFLLADTYELLPDLSVVPMDIEATGAHRLNVDIVGNGLILSLLTRPKVREYFGKKAVFARTVSPVEP